MYTMSSLQMREQAVGLLNSWIRKATPAPSPRREVGTGPAVRELGLDRESPLQSLHDRVLHLTQVPAWAGIKIDTPGMAGFLNTGRGIDGETSPSTLRIT